MADSAAEVIYGDQGVSSGHDLGDPDLATRGEVDDMTSAQTEHSAEQTAPPLAEHSAEPPTVALAEHSVKPLAESPAEHSAEPIEHSAGPLKPTLAEHSVKSPTEHSVTPLAELRKPVPAEHSVGKAKRQVAKPQPAANKNNVVQLSAQRGVVFDKGIWKQSSKKPGYLIRRISGYSIAETEYGVSYLWVISRKPDRTTADNSVHPLAGYFNWKALEASGLLVKERKSDRRDKTGPPLLLADSDEQTIVALAHLSMIAQAANGEYRPRPGEIEQRQAWLTSFIRTGQGIVNEADRQLARGINTLLSTQSGILSTQPDAA